ncbi:hypothetical protein [Falsirhodobacter sp. 20TX0035]|nr:hypothetical protein [Falsirhodobacter sp. 20TX0035]MDB6453555.1 hypothetical protein [Falsirhodobacter sp. 20TX0035]
MSDTTMGYIFFYGFWAAGLICLGAAVLAVFVIVRAIRTRNDGE